jgi:cytochrome d ubiquinol oxidase subunit I
MIIVGTALLGLVVVSLFFWWRGWLFDVDRPTTRWLLIALTLSVLGPQIANQAGWFTAELGRQPWIVYEMLKTSQALSKAVTAEQIMISLAMFAAVYLLLFILFVYLLTRKIQHGPDEEDESHEMPASWKAVLRSDDQEARI